MIELNWTSVLGAVLLGVGAAWFFWVAAVPFVKSVVSSFLDKATLSPVTSGDTDAPAPAGVKAYLEMVALAARTADDKTKWEYAAKEMTEAAVLRAEVDRLAGGKT